MFKPGVLNLRQWHILKALRYVTMNGSFQSHTSSVTQPTSELVLLSTTSATNSHCTTVSPGALMNERNACLIKGIVKHSFMNSVLLTFDLYPII